MDGTADSTAGMDVKKDSSLLAVSLLIGAFFIVLFIGYNVWKSRSSADGDNSWQKSSFSPPAERAAYLKGKDELDVADPAQRDQLKKLLMKRAITTIPLIILLQSEGTSIDRLYKKGMLTDDMHFKAKELRAFVDQEVQDVQAEADELADGWGQVVWQQGMQIHRAIQKQLEGKGGEQEPEQGEEVQQQPQEQAAPVDLEAEKRKADAAKKREKDKERARKVAALKDIGTSSLNVEETAPSSSSGPAAGAATSEEEQVRLAQQLIEDEERERAKGGAGDKRRKRTGAKK